jgi:hypothetical protein
MTLQDVAGRCVPPTTPQTIGRLETGARTLSLDWLNRIAAALEVEASDLVRLPDRADLPISAVLDHEGAHAPRQEAMAIAPQPLPDTLAIKVQTGIGDYRSGDEIWCQRIEPDAYAAAINRDILLPRPAGRFLFGRLIGREDGKLQLLPLGAGQRQLVIADPPWAAVAIRLIRNL